MSIYDFAELTFCHGQDQKNNRGGIAPSIQTIGSLLRTPWQEKPAGKMDSAKSQLDELSVDLKTYITPGNFQFYSVRTSEQTFTASYAGNLVGGTRYLLFSIIYIYDINDTKQYHRYL